MLLDLAALFLLLLFTTLGARRGTIGSAGALLALCGGYAAAGFAAVAFGSTAADALGVPSLIGSLAVGSAAFLTVAFAIGLASAVLRRAADGRRGEAPRSVADRCGGALFGLARGVLAALLLGFLVLWLDAARSLATDAPGPPLPPHETPLRIATRASIASGMRAVLPDRVRGEEAAVQVLTRPAETLGALRQIAEHPDLPELIGDSAFWADVESLRIERAMERSSFERLTEDEALREAFAASGLLDPADTRDPARLRSALRAALTEAGPRIAHLRSDPELLQLADDPQIAAALQRGDVLALLLHPDLYRLAARALSEPLPRRPTP
jgi:uncharacterized membrane protein required for colicin V production